MINNTLGVEARGENGNKRSSEAEEIRCKNCNKKFCIGYPGYDRFGNPKKQIAKCPRCKAINTISIEVTENLKVELVEKDFSLS